MLTTLKILGLSNTQVTDEGLVHLKGLTNLTGLGLYNTQVTDEAVKKLQQALPNCRIRFKTTSPGGTFGSGRKK